MSLDVAKQLSSDISKKLFKLKSRNCNGLLMNIIQTSNKKGVGFNYCDFQINGHVLALANSDGQIYIIDFLVSKYWKLKKLDSCTSIKLSECNESQLLVGKSNGVLEVINIDSGNVLGKLLGHQLPVASISFTQSNICISSSKFEAIIWDLSSYSKLQVLSLEKQCALKFVLFVPISDHILVCYKDDIIQLWQNGSFENLKQFHPSNWRNYSVKSINFSRNGKVMAVSGYLPVIAIFQLDIWRLLKIINLPDYINSVKQIQFIPQNFDGGCNKLLAILSGNGILYFYNVEENILISHLKSKCDINHFSIPSANANYISCLLCGGDVELYDIHFYIMKNDCTVIAKAQEPSKIDQKCKLKNFSKKVDVMAKLEIEKILEIDKLKLIIKEYQEFPEAFRTTIWEKILKLPHNLKQFNSIINHVGCVAFEDLQNQFPLEDKVTISCLRHLLNNIATWCPFFAQVEFLPMFLFPFVKVFHKKPVACFELCCTIIVNWCQHWFEYHPLLPVNVLAIIDNMLMEHDSTILQHFSEYNVKPLLYSWSLLETAFSEVLTAPQWMTFWDHVFINEISYLLCAVVAFIILQKKYILLLTKEDEYHQFFHGQRPLDITKFLNKTHYILNNTSEKNHPRQYLNVFTCLTCGSYPTFEEYPKNVINFQVEHVNYLEDQLKETKNLKDIMLKEHQRQIMSNDTEIKNEENRRMIEVEKACIEKVKAYQQNLIAQQEELKALRQELLEQENAILHNAQRNLNSHRANEDERKMEILTDGLDVSEKINTIEIKNLEEAYKLEGINLARKSRKLAKKTDSNRLSPTLVKQLSSAHKETVNLKQQVKQAKITLGSPRKAQIALTISTMDNLIDKIKFELNKERLSTSCNNAKENLNVHVLEKETKALQKDISQLLLTLNERESSSCSSQKCYGNRSCPNKTVRFKTREC